MTQEPNEFVSIEEKKNKKYGKQWAEHIYSMTKTGKTNGLFYNGRDEYQENYQYALGKNSIDKFKKWLKVDDNNQSPMVIDWRIRNFANNLFNVAVNMLAQEKYKPECTAIDPWSHKKRKQEKIKYMDYLKNPVWYDKMEAELGVELVPQGAKELVGVDDTNELARRMNDKLRMGMNAEKVIELYMNVNKYDQEVKKENAQDLIALGVVAQSQEMDESGRIRITYLDPCNIVVPYSNFWDFRDVKKYGYIHNSLSVSDLRERFNSELTDAEWQEIKEKYSKPLWTDYNSADNRQISMGDNVAKGVNVMEFWFCTFVEESYEIKQSKDNNPIVFSAKKGRGNSNEYKESVNKYGVKYRTNGKYDVYKDGYQVWFHGFWIIDSDYVLGYGPKKNMARNKNLVTCESPIKVKAPGMKNGLVTSKMSQAKPFLDDIQRDWLKIQQIVGAAHPSGTQIDLDFLEAANLAGGGGGKMTTRQLLNLFLQTGLVVGRSKDPSGQYMNRPPVTKIPSGLSEDIERIFGHMIQSINQLKEILGINDIVAAGLPNPRTGKKVAELSVQATSNAMYHLFDAQREMYLDASKSILSLYNKAVKNGTARETFINMFGIDNYEFESMSENSELIEYSVKLDIMPGNEQWDQFYAEVAPTIGKTITMSQWLYLKRIDNLKEAEQAFRQFEKEFEMKQAQLEKQRADYNAKVQQESNQIALENKIKEIEAEKSLIIEKGNQERITQEQKYIFEEELLKLQIKLETAKSNQEKIVGSMLQNEKAPR